MNFYNPLTNHHLNVSRIITGTISLAFILISSLVFGQTPSSVLPDLQYFKISFPVDANGNDNRNVDYDDREDDYIKAAEVDNLVNYSPPSVYSTYFYASGNEVVFRAHCAGALTSANAYPRCELRETPNGTDDLWEFADEHELDATFRVTSVPDQKQEVCMLQIKGNSSNSTSNTEEAFRLEYRQDGTQGLHVVINENTTLTDIMDYSVGETIEANMYVNNGQVTITLDNTDVSGSNGEWTYSFSSNYSYGYFKAGCYTQSSIWSEKNGVADELPDAYGEVRFSVLTLDGGGSPSCTASTPGGRSVGSVTSTTASLSWNAVANIDHYKVRHREVGTSTWVTSPSVLTNSYSLSGLSANTTYEWQVRSKCADNTGSNYSNGNGPDFTTTGSSTVSCTDGDNIASGESVVYYSDQQSANPASNITDGITTNRWSAEGFPQSAVIDLGALYSTDGVRLYPYSNRAYQFLVEGSTTSSTSGFSTLVDATSNTSGGSSIGKFFSAQTVRYVRVTITGASGYTGNWSSVNEFKVYCAGSSKKEADESNVSTSELILTPQKLSYYPNPFGNELTVVTPPSNYTNTSILLMDMTGRLVFKKSNLNEGETVTISENIKKGIYLLQWMNDQNQIIQSEKVIKQ